MPKPVPIEYLANRHILPGIENTCPSYSTGNKQLQIPLPSGGQASLSKPLAGFDNSWSVSLLLPFKGGAGRESFCSLLHDLFVSIMSPARISQESRVQCLDTHLPNTAMLSNENQPRKISSLICSTIPPRCSDGFLSSLQPSARMQ